MIRSHLELQGIDQGGDESDCNSCLYFFVQFSFFAFPIFICQIIYSPAQQQSKPNIVPRSQLPPVGEASLRENFDQPNLSLFYLQS